MNVEDPESRSRRVMDTFEDIAASNKIIARYLFWIRIWVFVIAGFAFAALIQSDDILHAIRAVAR